MAENESTDAASQDEKKGNPLILVGVIGVVMLLEAVGVYAVTSMMSPKTAEAEVGVEELVDEDELTTEMLLVEDRFINISTGRVWQWQATIHVIVKNKNLERVTADMEKHAAEIKEGVSEIIASAQDRHLREPARDTIKRQLSAYVNELFGSDAEGVPRIERVVISRWVPSPSDF